MIDPIRAALAAISRRLLKTPQAGPRAASSNALNYASVSTLDPSVLARAFAAADQGDITHQAALFELIEDQDAHVFGELSKRRRSVTGLGWQLTPRDDANQAEIDRTAELSEMLSAIPNFEDALFDITDAIGKGFSALEINWTPGEVWLPRPADGRRALEWVPQRMFRVENTRPRAGELLFIKDGMPVPLAPGRWIVHEHRAKSGYMEQTALFRVLAWTYAYKAYNVRDMQKFLETYGLPLRLGKYPAGIAPKERDALLRAVRGIGHDGAGVVPATMEIEFVQAMKSGTVDDFLTAIEYWERKQSIAILGGTLTSQADGKTSTNALGKIHDQIRREIMLHDVAQINPTINAQLLRPLALINGMFPPDRVPVFGYLTEETADQGKMIEVLDRAVRIGMKIDLGWAHKAMQIPRARDGAQVLEASGAAPSGDGGAGGDAGADERRTAAARRAALGSAPDANDDAASLSVDRLSRDAAPAIDRWLAAIEAMLENAATLEEFRAMLLAAWPELETDALTAAMSQAFVALDLRGRAEVDDENKGAENGR
jgi:phage gp29-like protein